MFNYHAERIEWHSLDGDVREKKNELFDSSSPISALKLNGAGWSVWHSSVFSSFIVLLSQFTPLLRNLFVHRPSISPRRKNLLLLHLHHLNQGNIERTPRRLWQRISSDRNLCSNLQRLQTMPDFSPSSAIIEIRPLMSLNARHRPSTTLTPLSHRRRRRRYRCIIHNENETTSITVYQRWASRSTVIRAEQRTIVQRTTMKVVPSWTKSPIWLRRYSAQRMTTRFPFVMWTSPRLRRRRLEVLAWKNLAFCR